jgi:21S rRNA (uridine2791-2'-O)-methyltransferase
MISQRAVQVSQKIISRRCFNPQCLGGEGLSDIARKLLGSVITSHSDARLSSSSTRWKTRQGKDSFARKAKLEGLKSRAAFKLLEVRQLNENRTRAIANSMR